MRESTAVEDRILKRSRASDFYSYPGLIRNVASERLLYVEMIKELLDNALDAKANVLSLRLKENTDNLTITVANNGDTFTGAAISRTFSNFEESASGKYGNCPAAEL